MDYSQTPTRYQRIKRKKRRLFSLMFFCFLFFVILVGMTIAKTLKHPSLSQAGDSTSTTILQPIPPTPTDIPNNTSIETSVQDALDGTNGSYGVVVKSLTSNEYYGFNQHKVFKSGSLYKLWVMAVVYQQVQSGHLRLTDTLSKNLEDLSKEFHISIDPSEPQTKGTISMAVEDALYEMVTISDNNAALLLTDKVHVSNVAKFLRDNEFFDSKVGTNGEDPTTTASDIALFFEKLYKGQLANETQTKNMLDLLKGQRLNDKIPLNLPDNMPIAHKTGELDDFSHDAGIIYAPNGDYILVVLSQSDNPQLAEGRIAGVSSAVYTYFTTQPTN